MGLFDFMSKDKKAQNVKTAEEMLKEKEIKENPLVKGSANVSLKDGKDKHWMVLESMTAGLEKHYFNVLRLLREEPSHGIGYKKIIKVRDLFDASVTSSFHGHVGTKISALQQQASQHMATLGAMVKTIFPIVRELRIMDERLDYYKRSYDDDDSAEVSLKSIWIESVEQGMQNPNSVYSLSTKVGYLTLPDLFFRISPKDGVNGVDEAIKSLEKEGVPKRVGDVCAKKLFAYYEWKEKTYKEMAFTRDFKLKYLRQHYNTIKMYMNWVRPYLQSISRLQMKGNYTDADLVSSFETAKIEVELLAMPDSGYKHYFPIIQVKFIFVSRPEMVYTPQGQKQPVHSGRTEIEIRPFVATQSQIDDYMRQKESEDLEILSSLDATMDAIKDDLRKYLREAGEKFPEDEKKEGKKKNDNVWGMFGSLGGSFKDLFGSFSTDIFKTDVSKKISREREGEKEKAVKEAPGRARLLYYVYKKALKMYTEI